MTKNAQERQFVIDTKLCGSDGLTWCVSGETRTRRGMVKYIWWLSQKDETEVRKRLERHAQKQVWDVQCEQRSVLPSGGGGPRQRGTADLTVVTGSEFPNESFLVTRSSVLQLTTTAGAGVVGRTAVPAYRGVDEAQEAVLRAAMLHTVRRATFVVHGHSVRLDGTDFVVRVGTVLMNGQQLGAAARGILEVDYPPCLGVCENAAVAKDFLDMSLTAVIGVPLTVHALAATSQRANALMQKMPEFYAHFQAKDTIFDVLRATGCVWWPESLSYARFTPLHAAATYAAWLPRYMLATRLPMTIFVQQQQQLAQQQLQQQQQQQQLAQQQQQQRVPQ